MSEPGNSGKAYHGVSRSMDRYRRALELIPGGTQLVSRRPTRYANGVSPVYAVRARGSRFWDLDGNCFIDWVSGIGAIIGGSLKLVGKVLDIVSKLPMPPPGVF